MELYNRIYWITWAVVGIVVVAMLVWPRKHWHGEPYPLDTPLAKDKSEHGK